jgi:DNA (cytosine-5)-methyltransferase 1
MPPRPGFGHGANRLESPSMASGLRSNPPATRAGFRFVDLFAGIGGIRGGLERAGGRCVFSVEIDPNAIRTYEQNWGPVDATDVRLVAPADMPDHEVLAAGFPCQPFSLAGVSKKQSLGRAHGFDDLTSGNLFFQIVRLIGGPWEPDADMLREEAETPDREDSRFEVATPRSPEASPVVLLENVRHLLSHDHGRTFRVIRRRLLRSGYWVTHSVVNGATWVPQNRRRTIIVALRRDLFEAPFVFPNPGEERLGPRLDERVLEPDGSELERYRLTDGVWRALLRHRARHEAQGSGFGYGIAVRGGVTRTLSARYYKDGAEILISMGDDGPPRRLTREECARLMGFSREHLGFDFVIPDGVSDVQAYRQFGNSVVVPQFTWIGSAIRDQAGDAFATRMAGAPTR